MKHGPLLFACLLTCGLLLAHCDRSVPREQVLEAMVEQQLVPEMQTLAHEAALLAAGTRTLSADSSESALIELRASWLRAMIAWERVYAYRLGPIVDNSGLLRTRFWPVRESTLLQLLSEREPITETRVEQLGVDVRGMYALEWLLFDEPSRGLLAQSGERGVRARAAATAFADNAVRYTRGALEQLGDGNQLTASLTASPAESVSKLVNQMTATIETLASDRLAPVLEMHQQGGIRLGDVQGARSASSRELVLAQLLATEQLYLGRESEDGLTTLVKATAPQIDTAVRVRFEKARVLLEQLEWPLEHAVTRDHQRVLDTLGALKELELTLKVDLASALGVTMTFTAGDGD